MLITTHKLCVISMQKQFFEYKDQSATLEAFIAYKKEKAPTILIFHAWRGRDEFVIKQAEKLAEAGYIGVALDVYGKGILGNSLEENQQLMEPFLKDRMHLRKRIVSGYEAIKKQPFVDPHKMASIGFCFGGLCSLDLARSGVDIKGAVSFHGILSDPGIEQKEVQAKILALHGHDDPMVLPKDVEKFEEEMTRLKVDWQVHVYGQTVHAFTNPEANDPKRGTVYNPSAEKRSMQSMMNFFGEIFG